MIDLSSINKATVIWTGLPSESDTKCIADIVEHTNDPYAILIFIYGEDRVNYDRKENAFYIEL